MRSGWLWLAGVWGCLGTPVGDGLDGQPDTATREQSWPRDTWNPRLPDAATQMAAPRGLVSRRAVFHLHSPWSHDACDGQGWSDGELDLSCLADLRAALCAARVDVAFMTDHPDHADAQPFEALFHFDEEDRWADSAQGAVASLMTCSDRHEVMWRAGFEDSLMPVGLSRHVDADLATRHDLLNRADAAAMEAMRDAGAKVLLAHTEGRELSELMALQDLGLHGVEAFNVHAMFAPDIRAEHLGLEPADWFTEIARFTDPASAAETDLLFLGVLAEQSPSIEAWDALLARGPMMATAGTDAHQNVLPLPAKDGERIDSYRRMLRWFSTVVLARGTSLDAIDEAVAERRAYIVFDALGTPTGLDFHLETGTEVIEMGAEGQPGTLSVVCPSLADGSPRGELEPELAVTVFRDGEPWQRGCGSFAAGPGVYRVRIDITPHHLRPFLTGLEEDYVRPFPWIYTGAIRVMP